MRFKFDIELVHLLYTYLHFSPNVEGSPYACTLTALSSIGYSLHF